MATFQARIEDYIGTFSDTTALSDWLTAGARIISDLLPVDELEKFAAKSTDSGSGVDVTGSRVVIVIKGGYMARRVSMGQSTQISDSTSIHYAISKSPSFYIQAGKGYCKPSGGDFYLYAYPTVVYSDSTVSNFPTAHDHTVVLYATVQACNSKINTAISSLSSESMGSVTVPVAPTVPVFTYTDATGTTVSSTSITVASSLPTYVKPVSTASFSNLESYISTDEDLEKANSEAGQQKIKLEQFQMDLYNELNEFNQEAKAYELDLQEAIAQAQITQQRLLDDAQRADNIDLANEAKELERQVAEYANKLQKYQVEVASYGSQVNSNVQEYATDIQRLGSEIQALTGLLQGLKAEYAQHIQVLTARN